MTAKSLLLSALWLLILGGCTIHVLENVKVDMDAKSLVEEIRKASSQPSKEALSD